MTRSKMRSWCKRVTRIQQCQGPSVAPKAYCFCKGGAQTTDLRVARPSFFCLGGSVDYTRNENSQPK